MKLNASQLTFSIVLLLLTVLSSVALVTQAVAAEPGQANSKPAYPHKTPSAGQADQLTVTEIKKNDKKILIEKSREMSPFFKIGIAINILMIIFFAWWFSTQWRAKK